MSVTSVVNQKRADTWSKVMTDMQVQAVAMVGVSENGKVTIMGAENVKPGQLRDMIRMALVEIDKGNKPQAIDISDSK